MIGYILLIILMIGAWTLLVVGAKKNIEWVGIIGVIFGLFTTVPFLVTSIELGVKHADAIDFQHNRDFQQELVYSISDAMSPQTVSKIITSATSTNEKIERNRRHCNSAMWGFIYNKGIAETELIEIPNLKYKIILEE